MKCFRLRCYVNNSFLVFHQGTKHSKTIKHSRFALVFHTVFSCLDPLMKHSNSLFTYNVSYYIHAFSRAFYRTTGTRLQTRYRKCYYNDLHPWHLFYKGYVIVRSMFVPLQTIEFTSDGIRPRNLRLKKPTLIR